MHSSLLIIVVGALYICSKVSVLGYCYDGEMVVDGNVTLDVQIILGSLDTAKGLQVNNSAGASDTVTFSQNNVTAVCLIVGSDTSCNCSTGYTWSNTACYNYNCCSDTTCNANVSYIPSVCNRKVNVQISGSITPSSTIWNPNNLALVKRFLQSLNGFQSLIVANRTNTIADFQATVSVKVQTSWLQSKVNELKTSLNPANIEVNTTGMVTILSPNTTIGYESIAVLKCMFEEKMDSAAWTLNQNVLSPSSIVQLNNSCAQTAAGTCTAVTLQKVTSIWVGTYQCRLTTGSITHVASAQLNVSLLPDVITMNTSLLTVDCSKKPKSVPLSISVAIQQSTEKYEVSWSYSGDGSSHKLPQFDQNYMFSANLTCNKSLEPQYFTVTFKNTKSQNRSAQVTIPVIYDQNNICDSETKDGDNWPKTPSGFTVFLQTCAAGRSGNKSRYCDSGVWQQPFDNCVQEQLKNVLGAADTFLQGLGATQEQATNIFQGLANTSTSGSNPSMGDISASINVLNIMAKASGSTVLDETIFPDLVTAASNLVNNTWAANKSVLHSMSSNYLASVEDLVANIKVNNSQGENRTNLQLAFCSGSECNMTVFDIGVNINTTQGTLKFFAVKNLVANLENNYTNMEATTLVSAILQGNNDSSVKILLDFPNNQQTHTDALCVFWNITAKGWSDAGCTVNVSDENHTLCECNHLTPFTVLISNKNIPTNYTTLDIITTVGLGVSIFSLLIFLIIEGLVWSAVVKTNLAHFRHTAMVNIAMFLLLADISFLASMSPSILPDSWCLILTICKHLFYLAMFCWMLCLSVMLVHQLIFVFSPLRKRVFMVFSGIVGYIIPILIVGSSYMYSIYMKTPYFNEKSCWLVFKGTLSGSIHAFFLPVGIILFTNIFCMFVIILTLVKSWAPNTSKDDNVTAKSMLKVVVVLTPILGITWIIGFFQLLYDNVEVLEFSFTILNSFQGLFILLTGCFTEQKIREELYKILMANSKETYDSTKNLISVTDTRGK